MHDPGKDPGERLFEIKERVYIVVLALAVVALSAYLVLSVFEIIDW